VMSLIRVGTVTEGVCRQLDPEFDFVAFVRSFLLEHGLFERELRDIVEALSTDIRASAPALARLPARADRLIDRLERGDLTVETRQPTEPPRHTLGYAVLAAALFIATAVLALHERPYEFVGLFGALVFLMLFVRSHLGR
jgi:predicted unusual protein kinase regulating ubiquinone biosynthesis (AarF/ABC1/UbiB family)